MANNTTFDHLQMQVNVGGHIMTGLADGDSVRLEPAVQNFEMRVGNRGFGTWFKRYNRSMNIFLDTLWGSDDISVLFRFFWADLQTPGGLMFKFSFLDANGSTSIRTVGTRILSMPPINLGEGSVLTWPLATVQWNGQLGSANATPIVDINSVPELSAIPPVRQAA